MLMAWPVAAEAMGIIGSKALGRALATALLLTSSTALAQPGATIQRVPPVQSVERLNENLTRLSRQPTDINALIGAGMAAYQLGDAQAANGFFLRADMVNPRLAQAKLGLALVALEMKQPADAARYFDAAAELGEPALDYLSERALAYDLAGEQAKAQRDYAAALLRRPGDRTIIRNYAISLGISGKLTEAETMLRPLLYGTDRGAWRDRAMILAMNGRLAEARKIVQSGLPENLAQQIDPYLARIGALPADRRAIAVHYGRFPVDGLRLDPVTSPPPVRTAANDKDRKTRSRSRSERDAGRDRDSRRDAAPVRVASAAPAAVETPRPTAPSASVSTPSPAPMVQPTPSPTPAPASPSSSLPAARATFAAAPDTQAHRPTAASLNAPAPRTPAAAMVQASPSPSSPQSVPQPGFSTAPVGPSTETPPPALRSLAQIMADIDVPVEERQPTAAPVDLTAVARLQEQQRKADQAAAAKAKREAEAKARAKAEADVKAKAEAERKALIKANPSRNWVQIATGREVAALAFDLRRLRRTYSALADSDGWTAEWGATRRLLVGPFSSTEKAKALQSELRKAGADSFVWQSSAGEVVTALSRK